MSGKRKRQKRSAQTSTTTEVSDPTTAGGYDTNIFHNVQKLLHSDKVSDVVLGLNQPGLLHLTLGEIRSFRVHVLQAAAQKSDDFSRQLKEAAVEALLDRRLLELTGSVSSC
jgi:hypothetical protein